MRTKCTFAFSLFLFCLIPALAAAQVYTIKDLGRLSPTGINSWAQVVGNYNGHGFIWTKKDGMKDLGIIPGGTFSWAAAINDLGVVTGTANGPGTVIGIDGGWGDWRGINQECSDPAVPLVQPFVWNQQLQGLGTVLPTYDSFRYFHPNWCGNNFYGTAINNGGQVVGFTDVFFDQYQWAFLSSPSAPMTIFGGAPYNFATGISNTGQIVGEIGSGGVFFGYPVYWENGVVTGLEHLSDIASAANGVNDLGQIVGWSFTDNNGDFIHAVSWTQSGTISDLGTLPGDTQSSATKINLSGLIIGSSGNTLRLLSSAVGGLTSSGTGPAIVIGRPFIWSERSGMRDLNTLIHGKSGWVLNSATDINVWGQIVGEGTLRGQPHGFLLTPRNPFK